MSRIPWIAASSMEKNLFSSTKTLTWHPYPTFRSLGERFSDYYLVHLLLVLLAYKKYEETQHRNRTSVNSPQGWGDTCISCIKSSLHWQITIFRKSLHQTAECGLEHSTLRFMTAYVMLGQLEVVEQVVMRMASSVWVTRSTEQPGRSGNNGLRDIDSFLGGLKMWVKK